MGTRVIVILFILILAGCKEKTEKVIQEPIVDIAEKPKSVPTEIVRIAQFGGISLSDTIQINAQIGFKSIDQNGKVDSIPIEEAIELYKTRMKSGKGDTCPIFEVNNEEDAIITTVSKGYGGNIRGTFLINRNSLEIKKVEFEHVAESEGYGAAIANTSFESQFVGTTVDFDGKSFGLNQNGKRILNGVKIIDGISGATTTSRLTILMVNEDLKKYKAYFQ